MLEKLWSTIVCIVVVQIVPLAASPVSVPPRTPSTTLLNSGERCSGSGSGNDSALETGNEKIRRILSTVQHWQQTKLKLGQQRQQQQQQRQQEQEPRSKDHVANEDAASFTGVLLRRLPFVTLSYAQTLDGMLAAAVTDQNSGNSTSFSSSNLPITSSQEAMTLTHGLRSIHDAIMIGGKTLWIDNPRLNVRLWPACAGKDKGKQQQPRPVVLDTHLRYCFKKEKTLWRAKRVIVCCSAQAAAWYHEQTEKRLPEGWVLLPCQQKQQNQEETKEGGLDIKDVLYQLHTHHDIQSVMVEGGGTVLSSFINSEAGDNENSSAKNYGLVDCLCITIAPRILGGMDGLHSLCRVRASKGKSLLYHVHNATFVSLGSDVILLGQWLGELEQGKR